MSEARKPYEQYAGRARASCSSAPSQATKGRSGEGVRAELHGDLVEWAPPKQYPGWVRVTVIVGSSALLWWIIIRVGSALLHAAWP